MNQRDLEIGKVILNGAPDIGFMMFKRLGYSKNKSKRLVIQTLKKISQRHGYHAPLRYTYTISIVNFQLVFVELNSYLMFSWFTSNKLKFSHGRPADSFSLPIRKNRYGRIWNELI